MKNNSNNVMKCKSFKFLGPRMVWFLEIKFNEMEFDDFDYICHHKGIHSLPKYAFLQNGKWVPTPLGWFFEIGRIYLIYFPHYTISTIKNKITYNVTSYNRQWHITLCIKIKHEDILFLNLHSIGINLTNIL